MMLRFATQRYSCQQCGRCCRRFLVPVSRLEIEAISKLPWEKGSDQRARCYDVLGGASYLKKDPQTGECAFLENGTQCRMHAAFGGKCKTISCRAYPFEFMRTFDDEITCAVRFDCPAVQQNAGEKLIAYRGDVEELLADPLMPSLAAPVNPLLMDGLTRQALEIIADFLKESLLSTDVPVPALALMAVRLQKLGCTFLNDLETLRTVLPSMREKAAKETAGIFEIGQTWPERTQLRRTMLECLKLDRQLPDFSLGFRIHQMALAAGILCGGGNPRNFGPEQPSVAIRRAKLFDNACWKCEADAWATYRRCLAVRLESRQFFASAYYQKGFFEGLQALFNTWKPAILLARLHAAETHPESICRADVDYATGLLDHCHGRRVRL